MLQIRKEGKLDIVEDATVQKPTCCTSANLAFHTCIHMVKCRHWVITSSLTIYWRSRQLYAHRKTNGRLRRNFTEDDIHMAHQYTRLSEQTVWATGGYYVSSHPNVAHVQMSNILTAFRNGIDQDSGLLDSHLLDVTTIMSQLSNSRHKCFSERLGTTQFLEILGLLTSSWQ